jgi:hypothetical protein
MIPAVKSPRILPESHRIPHGTILDTMSVSENPIQVPEWPGNKWETEVANGFGIPLQECTRSS